MKKILLACLLALGFAGPSLAAETTLVNSSAELAQAILNPLSTDITLGNNITLGSNDVTTSNDIPIDHTLTIRGNGKSISGSGSFPVFDITVGPVIFDNVEFKNGGGTTAAIKITGTPNVTFTGGKFDSNTVTAVKVEGGTVVFNGTSFSNNTNSASAGAVNVAGGTVTFSGATQFTGNKATGSGGALNIGGGTVTFNGNMNFTNNEAASGGAIAATVALSIDDKFTFTNNKATTSGGALHSTQAVNVSGGSFTGNEAGTTGNGGAVSAGAASAISGGTFTANKAGVNGGAFHGTGAVNVSGGAFTDNTATNNGGAVWAGAASTISEGTFTNNAGASGGAFYGAGNVTVTGGAFNSNKSTGIIPHGGGAIFAAGNLDVEPSGDSMTFTGQTAQNNGGALFSSGDITLTNVILTKNETTQGTGGATYSGGASTFTNCVFEDNHANEHGGAVFAGNVKAKQTTFRLNQAVNNFGGAVYLAPGAVTSEFDTCLFDSNRAKQDGGAVFVTGNQHVTIFLTSVFEKNYSASGRGGAASLSGSSVLFSRCTFEANISEPGNNAQGGAVFTDAATFKFGNCTFVANEAGNGKGGALFLGGGTTQDSVIFYCTFTENAAGGGQGGAVHTSAATVNFGASVFVGNTATHGYDIFRASGTIISRGYNILGNYGATGAGGPAGDVDWAADSGVTGQNGRNGSDKHGDEYTRTLLFGSNELADNVPSGGSAIVAGSSLSATQNLRTLATASTTVEAVNPALDYVPGQTALNLFLSYFSGSHTDARGVQRPIPTGGNSDVGAFESGDGTIAPPPPSSGIISYVRMSGIPNTMTKIGQTCSLTAVVYYQNGSSSSTEAVVWDSSNPNVAAIDQYGNLVSLMQGKTTISVTTERLDANNQHASDSADLEVSEEWSYTNIHPDVWKKLGHFNSEIEQYAEQLHFVDSDPLEIQDASFADAFKSVYGVSASQVSALLDVSAVSFASKSSYTANNWASAKPSISVSLSALSAGSLLPLEFAYSLSWDEVSKVMGRQVTKVGSVTELFGYFKLLFESAGGTTSPVVDSDGEFGIDAARALSSGALAISNGNKGLTLTLKVWVADAQPASDGKPRLIDDRLVVADGVADGTVAGSMWLLQRTGKGGETESSGGGGCNAGIELASLPLLLGFAWLTRRRQ
jgi:predicted outer membrane repeat protein